MKKIKLYAFHFLSCLSLLLLGSSSLNGQDTLCPPAAINTFSNTMDRAGDFAEFATKTIENLAGEYVVVGYEENAPGTSNYDLYFARFDQNGQLIGNRNTLQNNGVNLVVGQQPAELIAETQLIEVVLADGTGDGYLVAVTVEEPNNPGASDVMLIRLDKEGCEMWSRQLFSISTFDYPVGLFQDGAGNFDLFTARQIGLPPGNPGLAMTEVDNSGNFCFTFEYGPADGSYFLPTSVKPLRGAIGQFAEYVALGNFQMPQLNSNDQIGIGFIDANFNLVSGLWVLYDFDFPGIPSSREVSVDIEQDGAELVIVGSMDKVGGDSENFLLNVSPFNGAGGIDGAFNFATSYNNSIGNDLPTDLVVDEANGEYTMSFINNSFITGFPAPYLLQTDNAGGLSWVRSFNSLNEIFGYNFSLIQTSDGGYLQVGEHLGGPANPELKMWMAKTDMDGLLDNCECYEDIQIDPASRDLDVFFFDGSFQETSCDFLERFSDCIAIDQEEVLCESDDPMTGPCDSLSIVVTPIDTSNHSCCWSLSYENNSPDQPYYITIHTLDSVELVYDPDTSIAPPLRRFSFNDTMVVIGNQTPGPLPTGTFDDFFTFCLANIQNAPQQLVIEWRDSLYNVICDETLEFNCDPEPEECLYILSDSLICDTAGYKYVATFKNPINSGFPVGRIKLNVLNPTTGILVADSIIDLAPPLAIGDTLMLMWVIETEDDLYGEDFCFLISAHDGPDEMLCCAEIEKCIPFPQCDPCEYVDVMAMPIDTVNGDSCCYTFTVKNGYFEPGYFTELEMNILTPGVMFSGIDLPLPPAWIYDEIETGKRLIWSHVSGSIPIDTVDVFDFCLDGVTTTDSVYIEINWLQEDSIVCYDTLALFCPECVIITEDTLECQPDGTYKYTFNFTNLNDLLLPVNAIRVIDTLGHVVMPDSGEYILLPTPVPYGQTSTSDPMIILQGNEGDTVCFKMVFTYLNEDSVNVECCYVEHCIVLPPCEIDPTQPLCLESFAELFDGPLGGVLVNWTVNDGSLFSSFDVVHTLQPGPTNVIHNEPAVPGTNTYSYIHATPGIGTNTYQVYGNTLNGEVIICDSSDVFIQILEAEPEILYIAPNPAKEKIQLFPGAPGEYEVEIMSLNRGVQFSQSAIFKAGTTMEIDISAMPSGVYFIRLRGNDGILRQGRFVKTE